MLVIDLGGRFLMPGLINMHVHLITERNPLEDLSALRKPYMVVTRGSIIKQPRVKKLKNIEGELDKLL